MTEHEQDKVVRLGAQAAGEKLPYRIELWNTGKGETLERVLARALSAPLARAIFSAAQSEYPDRRITLRRGARVIADSSADQRGGEKA